MSYRFVRIANLYPEYLRAYYAAHPWIKERPYREQLDHLMSDSVDVVSWFATRFREIGVEASVIITNAGPLQQQWKVENQCRHSGTELVVEQLKTLTPDVVWVDDIALIDQGWLAYVRAAVPSVRIMTGHLCAPYHSQNIQNLRNLDFLITCTPCLRNEFEERGIPTHLLYHAFEPAILKRISVENNFPALALLFTGSLYTGGGNHRSRIAYLDYLLQSELPLTLYGNLDPTSKILMKMIYYYAVNGLRNVGAGKWLKYIPGIRRYETYGETPVSFYSREMKAKLRPPVFGLAQLKVLSRAAICFNIHGEIARGCAGNLRLFEATGVGSCLVTDWKANLQDLFEPDTEVITYKSREECVDKVKWLLENPMARKKIGEAGQARTLRDHTIQNRVQQIDTLFRSKM
jgi:spore maturation protein CgeB